MTLPIRMVPLPRSVAITAALLLAIAFTSLLIPSTHAQTDDSALAPSNLTAELVDGQVTLSWDTPAEDAGSVTGYEVLRRPLNGKDTLGILVADTGDTDTAFIDETANQPGVRYTYRVKALRGDVKSGESNHASVDIPESTTQPANPRGGSGEHGVYTWRDGDRIMTVRLEPSEDAQKSSPISDGKGVRTVHRSGNDAGPIFRSESGGGSMTLPGGVLLVLDPSWTRSDADAFFSRNGIKRNRVTELTFTENAYLVETAPGLPSLQLANSLAEQKGVEISSPNWMSEEAAYQEDPEDDGDTIATATDLPLNTTLEATIHAPDDVDFFRIELTESALVHTVNLDSDNRRVYNVRFRLLDSDGVRLPRQADMGIPVRRLDAGIYYIKAVVPSEQYIGPYNIQAMTIPDHGNTFESAAPLNLLADLASIPNGDLDYLIYGDFHSPDDVDLFKVDLSADTEVIFDSLFPNWHHELGTGLGVMSPVNLDAFDDVGNPLHPPIPGLESGGNRAYSLEAGTYYFRLSTHPFFREVMEGARPDYAFEYSLLLYFNAEYAQFIDDCNSVETNFDDPLLGCQGHLSDINVEEVWATNKGEGVNIAVVDSTMEGTHADLRDNVNETLNHDYTEDHQIINPRNSHGTAVASIIAARDNDLGVRGVAPRATVYNYNFMVNPTTANLIDAMARNKAVTAISNNSYGKISWGRPTFESQAWNMALETAVREGLDGRGTFYVHAAGNAHLVGDHVNLNERKNFYAQTTVCMVDSEGQRVFYSETGYALWVCAPLAEVTADNRSRYRNDFGGTSSAAPVVSGVAALVRSANPSLTWRDVKLVLAASARQNDPANPGWEEGALEYGSETERYSYNLEYGFGVVDAKAAVELAESWTNLPPMETDRVRSGEMELTIPDASDGVAPTTVSSSLTLGPEVGFTEFVEVHIHFDHPSFRDLEVELHSPAGTVSKLAVPNEDISDAELRTRFRFGSARHLGEDPSGEWTLTLTDRVPGREGSVRWWGIKVYGHGQGAGTQKPSNSPATGLVISGTVQVGATLSADVSSIDDWNGLSGATFNYQWIRNDRTTDTDTDIPGETEATYTLVAEDEGHAFKVRVTFTDNAGYLETVTSIATNAVRPLGICDRTKEVRKAILRMIRGVSDCSKVNRERLDRVQGNLVLTGSGITALQAGDFHDLPNVNELRLDRNDLETLPDDVFDGLDGLRRLRLNDNDLATLPTGAFDGLDGLRRLYLNDNDLDDLPDGAFDHLESLRRLRLNDNDLSELPDGVFDGLTGLRELWLHSNPGAPFNLTTELERRSDTSVVVRVAQGAPFDIEVTLSVTGGEMSVQALTTVTIGGGSTSSDEITMILDGDGPVTVSVASATLQLESDQTAKGIDVRAGDPLTLTEGKSGNTPAAGGLTISGTVRVDETLTADTSGITDADGLTNAIFTYQWLADDADIAGAIGLTYTLIEADEDKAITVQVSFTDDRGHQEALTSSATAVVAARPNTPATGLPTISGTTQVGQTLTADTTGIADADGLSGETFTYQWVSSDGTTDTDIEKATSSTYKLAAADRGKAIKVRVTFTDDGGNEETLTSAPTEPVLEEPVFGDGPPGAPRNLTVSAGDQEVTLSWEPPADNGNAPATRYRIEWRIDGKDYKKGHWGPSGETTYTKTDLANGVKYIFRVKAENGNGNSYGPYGPASEEVSATPTSGLAVDLGTPVLSNTKTLHHGMVKLDWEDVEDAGWYVVQYYHVKGGEWLDLPAAGVDIAFHGSSAVVSNLHGLSWLRVRAMSCAGESEWSQIEELYGTEKSDWEGVPVPEVEEGDEIEPCPVILGTPVLSDTETLHHGMVRLDWQDIEDAGWYLVQYYHLEGGEWLDLPAEGVDIAFHGSSAVVSNLHGLSWLRVRAASCDGASEWSQIEELYGTEKSDWEGVPVPEVEEGDEIEPCDEDADTSDNSPATGAPTISGTAQVGETLTANTSGIADADGLANATFSYQWLADDSDISGATNATYTLVAADEGKAVKVQVSFTDDEGNEETLTSTATDAVSAAPTPNSPATGAPAISGTAQVGQTLTADTSGIADADGLANATFSYQWLADDTDIAGATGLTYTLTDSEESKAITVQVSFTDAADNEETLTSAATGAVAGAQPTEPPAKPTGLEATATHDSVTLTWDDPGDDSITGYVILRRIPGVDPEGHFNVLVANTGTAATTYTDDTVSAETRYTYRIKAINGAGTSERSRWSHIDVPAAPVPDQPTGLEATESDGQVVLTWDDPGDDSITGYVILRRVRENDTGGDFSVLVADTGTAALTYTDDTVAAGLTYTYRIKAINEHGTSERSRWYHIDIPEAP